MGSQMQFGVASSAMQIADIGLDGQSGARRRGRRRGDQKHYENIMKLHVRLSAVL